MNTNRTEPRRPSAWKRRLSSVSKKGCQDTILHAVPPAIAIPAMTPLEKAMATSPNEEILSAIGNNVLPGNISLPDLPPSEEWNTSAKTAHSPSSKWRIEDSKVGVWRDGVAVWDVEARKNHSINATTAYTPKSSIYDPTLEDTMRPDLLVVIPNNNDQLRMYSRPSPPRYSLPSIPAAFPTCQTTSNELAIHPAFRTTKDFLDPPIRQPEPLATMSTAISRSSTASRSLFEETFDNMSDHASSCSHNSSMTSVEEEVEEAINMFRTPNWGCPDSPKQGVSAASSISSYAMAGVLDDKLMPTPHNQPNPLLDVRGLPSPTLSEAVIDLQAQLGTISEDYAEAREVGNEQAPFGVIQPDTRELSRAPTIPKKSRKREWRALSLAIAKPTLSLETPPEVIARRLSMPLSKEAPEIHQSAYTFESLQRSSSVRSVFGENNECEMSLGSAQISLLLSAITTLGPARDEVEPSITLPRTEAQAVLLRIMSCLDTFEDLHAMSTINKGMYQIFKANEMSLLQTVLKNKSPAFWELRQWSPVEFSELDMDMSLSQGEHSSASYIGGFRQDRAVVQALKTLILQRCQSFLRIETVAALMSDRDTNAQRFDDAFYRLWCFCKIFGCEKGREDDVAGQLDWLRGGLLAHQQGCAATVNVNFEYEMGGVLLNAPDHFAVGNGDGLSASQLYDMTELWNCLAALLSGYHSRIGQARSCGVYDNTGVYPGDIAKEEIVLEEWMSYILTLGPSVVLELARSSEDNSDAGFKVARLNGWTDWSLPSCGSNRNAFFREPVARLYEERLTTPISNTDLSSRESAELGRKRVASMAAEIKVARRSSNYQRLPLIDMVHERSMSVSGRRDSIVSARSPPSPPAHQGNWSSRRVSPIIEDRVEAFNRLSLLSLEGVAEDTSDRAIAKIVAMGFSSSQAKQALKLTDMGNGLRVDRAVDFLLRRN